MCVLGDHSISIRLLVALFANWCVETYSKCMDPGPDIFWRLFYKVSSKTHYDHYDHYDHDNGEILYGRTNERTDGQTDGLAGH